MLLYSSYNRLVLLQAGDPSGERNYLLEVLQLILRLNLYRLISWIVTLLCLKCYKGSEYLGIWIEIIIEMTINSWFLVYYTIMKEAGIYLT